MMMAAIRNCPPPLVFSGLLAVLFGDNGTAQTNWNPWAEVRRQVLFTVEAYDRSAAALVDAGESCFVERVHAKAVP